jgi:hypothetical protein
MRVFGIVLAIVLAAATGLVVGAKRLDEVAAARADLAVRSGAETYYIPSEFVRSSGWRVQMARLSGCWDARDAAMLAGMSSMFDCSAPHGVALALPVAQLGEELAQSFHKQRLALVFWPHYEPTPDDLLPLANAFAGYGDFAQRQITLRQDWKLWRIETPASPWVYLTNGELRSRDGFELRRLYAGRCYRPEHVGDAGMTCDFTLRVGAEAAVQFSLGADEMMSFPSLRDALLARVVAWRRDAAVAAAQ